MKHFRITCNALKIHMDINTNAQNMSQKHDKHKTLSIVGIWTDIS